MKYSPYSHSRIQTGNCPFAFKKRYIDRDRGIQRGNSGFGKVLHLVIADIIKAMVARREYSADRLLELHMDTAELSRTSEMLDILNTFHHAFVLNRDKVAGIEEAIAVNFDDSEAPWEDSYLRGVLDLIEIDGTHATITDHKTQFNILAQTQMDDNLQLSMYCYLAKCMYPQLTRFTVKIYFARYGAYRQSTRTLADLDAFRRTIDIMIGKIESIEEWVPIACSSCAFCEYISACPLAQYDPKGLVPPEVMTQAQAVREARLLRVREEQIKVAKERLKAFSSANGPIEISGDYAFGFVENCSTEWSPKEVREVFERHDHSLDGHVNFSKTNLRRLIKQAQRLDPDFASDLEEIGKDKKSTRFKGYKC